MSLGVWLAFYVILTFFIGRLYASFLGWKFARMAFFPGVVVAALGRSFACWVTGNDAKECDCWRKGGPVEAKGAPPGSVGFRLLFAIGPFLLALAGVLAADAILEHPVAFTAQLPRMSWHPSEAGETIWSTWTRYTRGIWDAILYEPLGNFRFWIYVYLAASFVVGCAPSLDDLKSIAVACASLAVASFGLELCGVNVVVNWLHGGWLWGGFSLLVAYAIFVLVASGVLFLPVKLLRDSRKEK